MQSFPPEDNILLEDAYNRGDSTISLSRGGVINTIYFKGAHAMTGRINGVRRRLQRVEGVPPKMAPAMTPDVAQLAPTPAAGPAKAPTPAELAGVWYWKSDTGFMPYDLGVNALIEEAFSQRQENVIVNLGGAEYIIDLTKRKQAPISNPTRTRAIRRQKIVQVRKIDGYGTLANPRNIPTRTRPFPLKDEDNFQYEINNGHRVKVHTIGDADDDGISWAKVETLESKYGPPSGNIGYIRAGYLKLE
jgi:hypothetical protein